MKHLLSLIAMAATTALLFILPGTAGANTNDQATTIPNASGHLTCTGTNPDGSDAAWTVGGHIYYSSDYQNPDTDYRNGWTNDKPRTDGNQLGSPCLWQIATLSNIQSGCAQILGNMNIYYTPNGGSPTSEWVASYSVPAPAANTTYGNSTVITFGALLNVTQAQYKVTSAQGGPTLGTVATSNL